MSHWIIDSHYMSQSDRFRLNGRFLKRKRNKNETLPTGGFFSNQDRLDGPDMVSTFGYEAYWFRPNILIVRSDGKVQLLGSQGQVIREM